MGSFNVLEVKSSLELKSHLRLQRAFPMRTRAQRHLASDIGGNFDSVQHLYRVSGSR